MAAVANNPKFAKKVGISKKVGEEFMKADEGRKFQRGGEMMDKKKMHKMPNGKMMAGATHKEAKMKKMAAGGMPMVEKNGQKVPAFAADGKGKMAKGGKAKCMAKGGLAAGHKAADGIAKKGKTKAMMPKMAGSTGMKRGGKC